MAETLNDNFESGGFTLWDSVMSVLIDSTSRMSGVKCANFTSISSGLFNYISGAEVWGEFKVLPKDQGGNFSGSLIEFMDYPTYLGGILAVNNSESPITYRLAAYRGPSTQLALGDTVLNAGEIYTIRFYYKPHATSGIFRVWVDDVLEIDYTGQTAPSFGAMDAVTLGTIGFNSSLVAYFDDVELYDSDPAPPMYTQEVTGGVEIGGGADVYDDYPLVTNRVIVVMATNPQEPNISEGGIEIGGEVTPAFVIPTIFVVAVSGGLGAGGRVTMTSAAPDSLAMLIRGGLSVGGRTRPVFVSPVASILAGTLYAATVQGGVLVGGSPLPVAVKPDAYTPVVSGGIRVSGPAISQFRTTTPASTGISTLSTRGGVEIGGLTKPVFVTPSVYRVPVDPRIIASIMVGGGGGAVFIVPQVFVQQVEGDIVVASESELGQDEVYETWALNGKNNEPAVFSGFRFNSFAMHNGVPYGAGEDGLFVLNGDTDDGELIHPGIRVGPMNFGMDCQKRLRVVNIGQAGAQTQVRVEVVDGNDRVFTPKRDPRRVPIDRDLQGEDFYVEVSDFKKLSHLEIIPLILFRK